MHIGTLPLHPINQPTSIDSQLNCISKVSENHSENLKITLRAKRARSEEWPVVKERRSRWKPNYYNKKRSI